MHPSSSNETAPSPETLKAENMGFSWYIDEGDCFLIQGMALAEDESDRYAYVVLFKPFPDLPEQLLEKLTPYENTDGEEVLWASFGPVDPKEKTKRRENFKPSLTRNKKKEKAASKPQEINIEGVANILLSGDKTIFYTGAGISIAAGVPDMNKLTEDLGIRSKPDDENNFTRDLLTNPDKLKLTLAKLSQQFFSGTSEAHKSISRLQAKFGFKLATENLDRLHQNANANVILRKNIDDEISDEELSLTPYIVTLGLQSDDSGLLHRYRRVNPTGKIISLNISPPPYLDDTDYYLYGDIQETVPQIEQLVF